MTKPYTPKTEKPDASLEQQIVERDKANAVRIEKAIHGAPSPNPEEPRSPVTAPVPAREHKERKTHKPTREEVRGVYGPKES